MGNVKYPQIRINRKQQKSDRMDGFRIGVWSAAAIFRDRYDVTDEEAASFLREALDLTIAFGRDEFDPARVFYDLERRTGIRYKED